MNQTALVSFTRDDLTFNRGETKEKLTKAMRDGIFYVAIPSEYEGSLNSTQRFAETIRSRKKTLSQFNAEPYVGYQERTGTQAVSFVAKQEIWKEAFAEHSEIEALATAMHHISLNILRAALANLEIPKTDWDKATGGLTEGKGTLIFSANHYRPGSETIGMPAHTDMGWITLLYINQDGLKAMVDGLLTPIAPKQGFFVANFGKAFEILVNDRTKLSACIHRVDKVSQERISFGLFMNHQEGSHMYQMSEKQLIAKQTYQEYLETRFKEFEELQAQAFQEQKLPQ